MHRKFSLTAHYSHLPEMSNPFKYHVSKGQLDKNSVINYAPCLTFMVDFLWLFFDRRNKHTGLKRREDV